MSLTALRWLLVPCLIIQNLAVANTSLNAGVDCYEQQDYDCALSNWLISAKQGDAWAQYNLGILYSSGKGTKQDYSTAAYWFKKSADQGEPHAQNNLAFLYSYGQGVPQNKRLAKRLFGKACANQFQRGCENYAAIVAQGF